MELNGIANITMLVQSLERSLLDRHPLGADDQHTIKAIKQQLEYLNRYMIAYADYASAMQTGLECFQGPFDEVKHPIWHEILENPNKYPTLKEKYASYQHETFTKKT